MLILTLFYVCENLDPLHVIGSLNLPPVPVGVAVVELAAQ